MHIVEKLFQYYYIFIIIFFEKCTCATIESESNLESFANKSKISIGKAAQDKFSEKPSNIPETAINLRKTSKNYDKNIHNVNNTKNVATTIASSNPAIVPISNIIKKNESITTENASKNYSDHEPVDDMILTKAQSEALFSTNAGKRAGLANAFQHWPLGIVPFVISPGFSVSDIESISQAMEYIQRVSCVKFIPKSPTDPYSIYFNVGKGCASHVGFQKLAVQEVILEPIACPTGRILHELLHCLGFLHMHTIVGREKFVDINWSNIKDAAKDNFKPYYAHVSMYGTNYDFNSIMHYSKTAFSIHKNINTIDPRFDAPNMGQRDGMSEGDISRLNKMYNCPERTFRRSAGSLKKINATENSNNNNTYAYPIIPLNQTKSSRNF